MSILQIEDRQNVSISIIPNKYYEIPQISIKRIQENQISSDSKSFKLEIDDRNKDKEYTTNKKLNERPLVDLSTVRKKIKKSKKISILSRIVRSIFSSENNKPKRKAATKNTRQSKPKTTTNRMNSRTRNTNDSRNRHPNKSAQSDKRNIRRTPNNRLHGSGQLRTNRRKVTAEGTSETVRDK